jgi:hypothetical protein
MDWDVIVDPFRNMINIVLEYAPRIITTLILLLVAWILAKVLRSIIRKALRASRVDRLLALGGFIRDEQQFPFAHGVGTAVFWLVWLFFGLAILQVFGVEGIFDSVVVMFDKIFAVIPNIIGASIILVVFYLIARLLGRLVTKFLTSIHFNEILVKLGIARKPAEGAWTPAGIAGYLVLLLIMFFAVMTAADVLGFVMLSELVSQFTEFFALVILGVIILGIGIFLANLAANVVRSRGRSPALVSSVRIFIMVLVVAIALRTMGFANDIVLLGFGLMLGTIAVATAIAFGFGGREIARELLSRWTKSQQSQDTGKLKK